MGTVEMGREQLPVVGSSARVRRDAVANADRILCTARGIVEAEGVDGLTMDRLAAEACVGKGTVFRAFGSRAGVFAALADASERRLQQAHLTGPPPLGPGAPPLDRLLAYGAARLQMDRLHARLMLAVSQASPDKYDVPARQVAAMHLRMLLRQCGVEQDVDVLAEALLAPLDADLVQHLTHERGVTEAELLAGWQTLVRAVVG